MKTKYIYRRIFVWAAIACLLAAAMTPSAARAAAPNFCYLKWTLPNSEVFSPFGANRGSKAKPRKVPYHAGVDVCMPHGTIVPVTRGSSTPVTVGNTSPVGPGGADISSECHVIAWENTNSPIHHNPGGFGLYTRFDCGKPGGHQVEVMMAHLSAYSGPTHAAVSGMTGNACNGASPMHVHLEVFIDQQVVDPQCVFGLVKGQYKGKNQGPGNAMTDQCPQGITPGKPANLCDSNIINILKSDGRRRVPITRYAPKKSYPPEYFAGKSYGEDTCPPTGGNKTDDTKDQPNCQVGEHDPNEQTDEGSFNEETGNVDEGTYPIGEEPDDPTDPTDPGDSPDDDNPPDEEEEWGEETGEADIPPLGEGSGEPNNSCAVDTMVAMTNRATLETRRETLFNRRFIAKADSVFDYSCFPIYLNHTQEKEIAGIFSETDLWVNRVVDLIGDTHTMNKTLGEMSMDTALANVIWKAHLKYKAMFNHPLLGGLEGYNEYPQPTQCQDMKKVWEVAKCQNFPAADEVFLKFEELIGNDPRKFPTPPCNDTKITQSMIDAAEGVVQKYDKVKTHLEYLSPEGECKNPIATGVTVYRHGVVRSNTNVAEIKTYTDGVCSNTGCTYYNPGMSGTGQCKKN